MDLMSESDAAGRVLAARYVSADKALLDINNAINSTLLCHQPMDIRPKFSQYSAALQMYGPILWSCGFLAVVISCLLFVVTLKAVRIHRPVIAKHAVFVLAVYPIVIITSYIATWVTRARLVTEAVGQQAVMVGMYQLFCLLLAECGGVDQFVRRSNGSRLETRVLPCCCWPCCTIPRPVIKRSNLMHVRYLVLQMPIIQALIYVIFLVLWVEDEELYERVSTWFQPFVAASILFGVWGVIITVRTVEAHGIPCRARFLALQVLLLVVKLQCGMAKFVPFIVSLPCFIPLHPMVLMNLLHNLATMLEAVLLSLWTWRLYSTPPQKRVEKAVSTPDADKAVRTPEITYQSERKY